MNIKTLLVRATVTPFMALGGFGIGSIFTATHPALMPWAGVLGSLVCLMLCFFMYWRSEYDL